MRSLRVTMLAVAALAAVALAGTAEAGCGDDTSGAPLKSSSDASTDGETAHDGGGDSLPRDSGNGDAPGTMADGGVGLEIAVREATAQCGAWLNCCPGGLDGGTYDLQRCIDSLVTYGWEGTLPSDERVYSRGHLVVDQAKAAKCITALSSFPCGQQTAANWASITSACELVMHGTIASNSTGCISSFECAPGNYCDPTVDGGLCTPLATKGQRCNTKIMDPTLSQNPLADEMCSYLSSGQPALFCDVINNAPDAATCQPLLPKGASCSKSASGYYDDQACAPPALCGDNLQCGGTASYPYMGFCRLYQLVDAGGPG